MVERGCWNTIRIREELEHCDERENRIHLCRTYFSWAGERARRIRLQKSCSQVMGVIKWQVEF